MSRHRQDESAYHSHRDRVHLEPCKVLQPAWIAPALAPLAQHNVSTARAAMVFVRIDAIFVRFADRRAGFQCRFQQIERLVGCRAADVQPIEGLAADLISALHAIYRTPITTARASVFERSAAKFPDAFF